jgi:hypothetical protein
LIAKSDEIIGERFGKSRRRSNYGALHTAMVDPASGQGDLGDASTMQKVK